ncbi:MAG TPA: amidohydrolase family protein [Solirubrobacteraceae bacterium]|nr:amidohydrolase family protein [Solirubrobacteraceae bacterium]
MTDKLLIKGGYVLTMDPAIGELERGDVLVEDGRIAQVAANIDADAAVIDASGDVVMPGFVDTHRHTWQTALRAICADWSLMEYFRGIRQTISPRYAPEDVFAGNYVGALEALNAGVTTILDFSHCMNSPWHADAALEGLREAGIRAVFGYGYFPAPSEQAGFGEHVERIEDARRIRRELLSSDDALVTMGIALTEVGLLPFELTKAEIESARELDALVVTHTGCTWGGSITGGVRELAMHGLLDSEQVHVHCNCLDDGEFDLLADAGAKVSMSPETELNMGMGHPVVEQCVRRGMKPTLSCDVISLNSGDMFAQMRLITAFQRCMENDPVNAAGEMPERLALRARDVIAWATTNGAEALGLGSRTGSLTPGKRADVIVVGGASPNMTPRGEAAGSIVFHANPGDVRHVLVEGTVVKRDGELVGVDSSRVRALAEESRERVLSSVLAHGPLLPDPVPDFAAQLDAFGKANIARAHELSHS